MADYSRYKTATLEKMRDAAWEKYQVETLKPGEGWGSGFRKVHLCDNRAWEKAKERYDAICEELRMRRTRG